jgi:diguanylate cyclase (GGDEF)-like protein
VLADSRSPGVTRGAALALAVMLVVLAGLGDYFTGDDAAFTLVYLGPVVLAAWRSGRSAGLIVSVLSALSWLVVDHQRAMPVSLTIQAWNLVTQLGVFVTVSWLLAALQRRLELESRRGLTDPLTGLKNRRAFDEAAAAEIARARRHHHPFTVAFMDLDGFKGVNDDMGHEVGDQVLVGVAEVLRFRLRAVDLAARLGGDEFALLFPETDEGQAAVLLHGLFEELRQCFEAGGWPVGLSIGSVTFETPPPGLDDALRQADALMYEAKRAGKGRLIHKTSPGVASVSRDSSTLRVHE